MMRPMGVIFLCLLLLTSCHSSSHTDQLKKAGLLVPETVNDQVWGTKGYKGMLQIQSQLKVDVFYKESMDSLAAVERAVHEFKQKGTNLVFGHGNEYAHYFNELSADYPDIHFVSFNGSAVNENTTTLNFQSFAMGFFGGMVAGFMTKTNEIGIIAAYDWQPEIEGFIEGVAYENPDATVTVEYTHHWDDPQKALHLLDELLVKNVDIVYPAGDGFNVPVIEKLKENGLFAIGFVSDQSDLGEFTVLTSTVQHVDKLYELVAKKFNEGTLQSGDLYFDFQDGVISMGAFSPLVDQTYIDQLNEHIKHYKETGELPSREE
ncbi:transcriptional regulator Med [Bacillus carboniphilus]|uniref:Transcriptional regulator Med n=1 Tax=Bacillus carboniphilus TaxID=86663 RepID=A0ABN0VQG7_9BACI